VYPCTIIALLGDLDALKEQAWCNFEFLLARLHSSSVHALLSDLDLTLASVLDADIHLVLQAVVASKRVLALDSLQLAGELIGRLRQLKGAVHIFGNCVIFVVHSNILYRGSRRQDQLNLELRSKI